MRMHPVKQIVYELYNTFKTTYKKGIIIMLMLKALHALITELGVNYPGRQNIRGTSII